jgi:hypothetical protein
MVEAQSAPVETVAVETVAVETAAAEVAETAGPEVAASVEPEQAVVTVSAAPAPEAAPEPAPASLEPETECHQELAVEVVAVESSFESDAVVSVKLSPSTNGAPADGVEAADEEPSSGAIEVLVAPESPLSGAWLLDDDARLLGGAPARAAAAPDPEPGESLGAYLRRFRLARRISLDEVSASTRIPVRSLNLLESDDFAALPAEVFVKGFIRCYTRAVGLDNEVAMGLYEGSRPRASVEPVPAVPTSDGPSRRTVSLALVTLIVVILATLTLSILFARPRSSHLERADLQAPPPASAAAAVDTV